MKKLIQLSLLLIQTTAVLSQDNWRLKLQTVKVNQQREASGDRPYFYGLYFRFLLIGNRTVVEPIAFEPNDWVSKPEYRAISTGNHMSAGNTAVIPWWTGEHVWPGITMTTTSSSLSSAPEVCGALIFCFDNNNTPPHVMKNVMDKLSGLLTVYINEFKRGISITTTGVSFQTDAANAKAVQFVRSVAKPDFIAEMVAQLTIGSTSNPDKPTGIHALLFTNASDILQKDTTIEIRGSDPVIMQGRTLTINGSLESFNTFHRTILFKGSGAEYAVRVELDKQYCTNNQPMNKLTLKVKTGRDDLRGGSFFDLICFDKAGKEIKRFNNVNAGAGIASQSTFTKELDAGGLIYNNIAKIKVQFTSVKNNAFETGDNWDLEAVSLEATANDGRRYWMGNWHNTPVLVRFTENEVKEKELGVNRCR